MNLIKCCKIIYIWDVFEQKKRNLLQQTQTHRLQKTQENIARYIFYKIGWEAED